MALDEALMLENLAVAMHGEGGVHPARRRRRLEGYFALKREATVELLAACHGRSVRVEKYREKPGHENRVAAGVVVPRVSGVASHKTRSS